MQLIAVSLRIIIKWIEAQWRTQILTLAPLWFIGVVSITQDNSHAAVNAPNAAQMQINRFTRELNNWMRWKTTFCWFPQRQWFACGQWYTCDGNGRCVTLIGTFFFCWWNQQLETKQMMMICGDDHFWWTAASDAVGANHICIHRNTY